MMAFVCDVDIQRDEAMMKNSMIYKKIDCVVVNKKKTFWHLKTPNADSFLIFITAAQSMEDGSYKKYIEAEKLFWNVWPNKLLLVDSYIIVTLKEPRTVLRNLC